MLASSQTPIVTVAVLGAGTRGWIFGEILKELGHLARVVAVAEPREPYRARFAHRHALSSDQVFDSWEAFAARARRCDAVIISTMDRDHQGPAIACMERGYHVLLEKPMAPTYEGCVAIERSQRRSGAIVAVCHSLRYHKSFQRLKATLDSGAIGRLLSVDLVEQVQFAHFAHSYVRGNWGNAGRATPMLLAKSCHDLDYLAYLAGAPCRYVTSFGSLSHFTEAQAPPGSTERCTQGCRVEAGCPYSAIKQYVLTDLEAWPASVVAPVHTREAHLRALEVGPYGRCVFRCDNDVVDHQVVALEFENAVTATFTVTAFSQGRGRVLRLHGSQGEIQFDERRLTLRTFADGDVADVQLAAEPGEHGGGDHRVVRTWLEAIRRQEPSLVLTSVQESLGTHRIGFAAERSRAEKRTVPLAE